MPKKVTYDFGGWATKAGVKCSDGRTILKDAFAEQDGMKVPLVWQHMHNDPENILGYAILENRPEGVYTYAKFNDSKAGQNAKLVVQHEDIQHLSIYANSLIEKSKNVIHGVIREVSLVLAGANPGAKIDYVSFEHSDGSVTDSDEDAIIYTDETIDLDMDVKHSDDSEEEEEETLEHAKGDETVQDILDTLNDKQLTVVYALIGQALDNPSNSLKQSAEDGDEENNIEHAYGSLSLNANMSLSELVNSLTGNEKDAVYQAIIGLLTKASDSPSSAAYSEGGEPALEHSTSEGDKGIMKTNVFDGSAEKKKAEQQPRHLTHAQFNEILETAQKTGSFKAAFLQHAGTYGIDNIDYLFPDAQSVTSEPTFITRDMAWVSSVLNGARHSPFSRIKSLHADITPDEARALGYITGNLKTEEVFALLRRITTPTTVYKKQKLDRDDIVDITDLDVVAWLKREMRVMLNEEIARAMLVSDGRDPVTQVNDKIDETCIRPIWTDDAVYVYRLQLALADTASDIEDAIIQARVHYKGSGAPVLYTTTTFMNTLLLRKDTTGRRIYKTKAELAAALLVSDIVEVPVMENLQVTGTPNYNLRGIIVNMRDYTVGADKGGEISFFDDFDIDYNQYKYLLETRISGALVLPSSAIVIEQADA